MKTPIVLAGLLALAMLTACSKPAPTPTGEEEEDETAPAAAAQPQPAEPQKGRAEYVDKLLALVDTTPECQQFRTRLEAVRNAPGDEMSPDDMNQMNSTFGEALRAGCRPKQ